MKHLVYKKALRIHQMLTFQFMFSRLRNCLFYLLHSLELLQECDLIYVLPFHSDIFRFLVLYRILTSGVHTTQTFRFLSFCIWHLKNNHYLSLFPSPLFLFAKLSDVKGQLIYSINQKVNIGHYLLNAGVWVVREELTNIGFILKKIKYWCFYLWGLLFIFWALASLIVVGCYLMFLFERFTIKP